MAERFEIPTRELHAVVRGTFPGYKRRGITVVPHASVSFYNLSWDGGSRNEYRLCHISGGAASVEAHKLFQAGYGENRSMEVPRDHVIVQGGTFMGKTSRLYVYVRPEQLDRLNKEGA